VRFLRQFAAVLAVVAVVVIAGVAWDHFGPASLPGEGPAGNVQFIQGPVLKLPPGVQVVPGGHHPPPGTRINTPDGAIPVDVGDLLQSANLAVLRQTAVLEALIMAGVVILSIAARKARRARRRRAARVHTS
jgi:hypothetical protein